MASGAECVEDTPAISRKTGERVMLHQKESERVYYHVLEGSRFIFADEINKKKLLDIVLDVQKREEWRIHAFCLTDDSAHFVTETTRSGLCRGMADASREYLHEFRKRTTLPGDMEPGLYAGGTRELDSLQNIAFCCREIHRLPLERGYVRRLDDYWWSSYITYAGIYDWAMVDCRTVLVYFSANPDTARRKLQRFHQASHNR